MKIPKLSPLKQIRKQCLDCCSGSVKAIRFCHSTDCPLWYLRLGKFPRTVIKANGENWKQLFDRENFKRGEEFSPDKRVEEYKL